MKWEPRILDYFLLKINKINGEMYLILFNLCHHFNLYSCTSQHLFNMKQYGRHTLNVKDSFCKGYIIKLSIKGN